MNALFKTFAFYSCAFAITALCGAFGSPDCQLHRVVRSERDYDEYFYDPQGQLTHITTVTGKKTTNIRFQYTNGLLVHQIDEGTGNQVVYSHENGQLSKVVLKNKSGEEYEFLIEINAQQRIQTITLKQLVTPKYTFNDIKSYFVYDEVGNCTLIEVKNAEGMVLAKTNYADFQKVSSHYVLLKGHYFNPSNKVLDFLTATPIMGYPNTAPNQCKTLFYVDVNTGKPLSQSIVMNHYELQRKPNERGLTTERGYTNLTDQSKSILFFEYQGCR